MGRDTAVWKRGPDRGTLYVYYRCRGRRVPGRAHAQTTRKAQRLDTPVWQVLMRLLRRPRPLQEALTAGQPTDPHTAEARARGWDDGAPGGSAAGDQVKGAHGVSG
jgi:hypothetical protein